MSELAGDTKQKILKQARSLFALHGFDGATIRDIANAAEVNVASMNYHFNTKENLFLSVIDDCYLKSTDEVNRLALKHTNLEDLLVAIFDYFVSNEDLILNHFKMLTSPQGALYFSRLSTVEEYCGPPGFQTISEAIGREVPGKVSREDLHWGLTTLYSHIAHNVIMNSCFFKHNPQAPFSGLKDLEKGLRRLVRAVLAELKSKRVLS